MCQQRSFHKLINLKLLLTISICLFSLAARAQLSAVEWPKSRATYGNTAVGNGAGTVGLLKWTSQALAKQGLTAPAVVTDVFGKPQLVVGDKSGTVYYLDADTGNQMWTGQVPQAILGGGIQATPVQMTHGGILVETNAGVATFDAIGNLLASAPFDISSQCPPAVTTNGSVLIPGYIGLTAIDPVTLAVQWVSTIGGVNFSPAIDATNGDIYACTGSSLYCLDKTGKFVWTTSIDAGTISFAPILTPNRIVLCNGVDIIAVDKTTHQITSDFSISKQLNTPTQVAKPLAVSPDGKTAYLDLQGILLAIDLETGTLAWKSPVLTNRNNAGMVIVGADGTIYDGLDDPSLVAFSPTGSQLWSIKGLYEGGETTADLSMGSDGKIYLVTYSVYGNGTPVRAIWGGNYTSLKFSPNPVVGGNSTTATITLTNPAPAGGLTFAFPAPQGPITSYNPNTVTIEAGALTATSTVSTAPVATDQNMTLTATCTTKGSPIVSVSGSLGVLAPSVASVNIYDPTANLKFVGGAVLNGTVYLNGKAPANGMKITVTVDNLTGAGPASQTITVAANQLSGTFNLQSNIVTTEQTVKVTVTAPNGSSVTKVVKIEPIQLSAMSVPSPLGSGASGNAYVYINAQVPAGQDWTIPITATSNGSAIKMKGTPVVIHGGSSSGSFVIVANAVSKPTNVTLSASYKEVTVTGSTTIVPLQLKSISVNPSSVNGYASAKGIVTLNGQAPLGGFTVTLSSSNKGAAAVPASVHVNTGNSSAEFKITTVGVATDTLVTFTGSGNGSATGNLTVLAPTLTSLKVISSFVTGGISTTGKVTLSATAPAAGFKVTLSSSSR